MVRLRSPTGKWNEKSKMQKEKGKGEKGFDGDFGGCQVTSCE